MPEIITFIVAGSALGMAYAWLQNRQPSTLGLLCALYAVSFFICLVVAHAASVGVVSLIVPYVLVTVAASIWSAGLVVRWPAKESGAVAASPAQ